MVDSNKVTHEGVKGQIIMPLLVLSLLVLVCFDDRVWL